MRACTSTPFRFEVSEAELADLRYRLEKTRWPEQTPGTDWTRGIPVPIVKQLADYWRQEYDWRVHERRLHHEQQFLFDIDGSRIHAARRPSTGTGTLPLLVTHGWPYTYAQMLPLADAVAGEIEVIAPSLPGFAHSAPLDEPFGAQVVAKYWHRMMTEGFGYDRYLVYGEDVGAPVTDWLAATYPEHVAGIVTSHPSYSAQSRQGVELTAEERNYLAGQRGPDETGYAHQQATRPDTLSVALLDSPAGLLAWITEKVIAWSHGGTGSGLGDLAVDDVLTLVSLFWFTRSIGTSFRAYAEADDFDAHPLIDVPASVLIQTHEHAYPRSLAEKSYRDMRSFTRLSTGGHFTAWENPAAVAAAVTDLENSVR